MDSEVAVQFALSQLGKWYKLGTSGPNTYDCSGLVYTSFGVAGLKKTGYNGGRGGISRVTWTQVKDGVSVSKAGMKRGDIVFPEPGHVGIYLGDGTFVNSPHPGARVRINRVYGFYAARRLIENNTPTSGGGIPTIPIGDSTGVTDTLKEAVVVFRWLSDTRNWRRIGYVLLGLALIGIATWYLMVKSGVPLTGPQNVKKLAEALS